MWKWLTVFLALVSVSSWAATAPAEIVCPRNASVLEQIAAREVCRYVYLRTGKLLPIVGTDSGRGSRIVIGCKDRITGVPADTPQIRKLKPQQYLLKTVKQPGRTALYIIGGDDAGTLYGAYRFAEHLGVRFYLHGDVVPDERIAFALPTLNEFSAPTFALRGIQPFHDFPEGPDWWNLDDYRAVISQLPKLGMNFIGLHTYPEGGAGPEPTVWIGPASDVNPDGTVRQAYPSHWANTMLAGWGYLPKKTSEYCFGADQLFEQDAYGHEVMSGRYPKPSTPDECVDVFNRTASFFRSAFGLAKYLGVKTCVGTETPLRVPQSVAERIMAKDGRPWGRPIGGRLAKYVKPIAGTEEDSVYQTVRWDLSGYEFYVPNGAYSVILKFSEIAHTKPDMRVFGVKIQGRQVIDRIDILAEAGPDTALDKRFDGIVVEDGKLRVDFVPIKEYPCIAGIEIRGLQPAMKVDCGGDSEGYIPEALNSAMVEDLYEGMFTWIARNYPIDYYWLWTPEDWTWSGSNDEQVEGTKKDLLMALEAARKAKAPFTLATCGWVLGPAQDRAMFDSILPKEMPFSSINREVGNTPVDASYADVQGRSKWAIPWLEDDPTLTHPQLFAGRMVRDAADALLFGCDGLMGIHWRTRVLSPNVGALASAAWGRFRTEGPVGGDHASFADAAIDGTDDDGLYSTVRFGMSAYRFEVPSGRYKVLLCFCEPHYGEKGKRVFSVRLEGSQVLDKLDIFDRVGKNKALDQLFDGVEVKDGWLDIDFVRAVDFPIVSAIEITGEGIDRKINCGGPAVSGYQADWRSGPNIETFYRDWATAQFGPEVAARAARIFAGVDGRLPKPSTWRGPGAIVPDKRSIEEIDATYAFADQFASLRPRVQGKGNLERFDYWLNQFEYMRATDHLKSIWFRYDEAIGKARQQPDSASKAKVAEDEVLPLRKEMVRALARVYKYLLPTIGTQGEIGNLDNWERHIIPMAFTDPDKELVELLGHDLPSDAKADSLYSGPLRLVVPTVRGSVQEGERLRLRVMALSSSEIRECRVHWRPIGQGQFREASMEHLARGVYSTVLPPASRAGIEYYITAGNASGETAGFPATAPDLNQTVIALPKK